MDADGGCTTAWMYLMPQNCPLIYGSVQSFSHVRLFETQWTVAHQVPLSMEFSSKNPGISCHSLLQQIFLTLHCRWFFTNWAIREFNQFSQFSSVSQSCPILCDPMNRSTPGLPAHRKLPEFTQTHAHQVSDAIQPSHPLSSPSPPAPNPSQHQGLFKWVNSSH